MNCTQKGLTSRRVNPLLITPINSTPTNVPARLCILRGDGGGSHGHHECFRLPRRSELKDGFEVEVASADLAHQPSCA